MSAFHVRSKSVVPSHVCIYISQIKNVRIGEYTGSDGGHWVSLLYDSSNKLALLFASYMQYKPMVTRKGGGLEIKLKWRADKGVFVR